jgi:hypothetical protein
VVPGAPMIVAVPRVLVIVASVLVIVASVLVIVASVFVAVIRVIVIVILVIVIVTRVIVIVTRVIVIVFAHDAAPRRGHRRMPTSWTRSRTRAPPHSPSCLATITFMISLVPA